MSNYLSIAAVTATLQQMIQEVLEEAVPGATVRVGPPRSPGPSAGPEVNLYLYMVSTNASLRNRDLPTRGSSGVLLDRPAVAIDLHYVVSFFGEQDLAAERMMGKIASRFHAHPVITLDRIRATLRSTGSFPYLVNADFDQESTVVRLNPYYATLEEISKLWTVFFQMAHRLSLQYIAGPVVIDADDTPRPALPTAAAQVAARPGLLPHIASVKPLRITLDAPGSRRNLLTVLGSGFAAAHVEIGGKRARFSAQKETALTIEALPDALTAGAVGVEVINLDGARSNLSEFTLLPRVVNAEAVWSSGLVDGTGAPRLLVQLQVDPAPAAWQRPVLLLNQLGGEAGMEIGPPLSASGGSSLAFALPQPLPVPPGPYLLRIRLKQDLPVESLLQRGHLVHEAAEKGQVTAETAEAALRAWLSGGLSDDRQVSLLRPAGKGQWIAVMQRSDGTFEDVYLVRQAHRGAALQIFDSDGSGAPGPYLAPLVILPAEVVP